jgi:KDO2-lipid IV(A) lauroyltransferase
VGILIDQNPAVGGVFVDFFGRPAATAAGAAAFALRTGAAVVPAFCYRRADDTLMVQVFPRVPVENTGDRERDILVNTQRFTAVIEEQVRERPDLWLWIHRRWMARPPGERAASQGRPDA